MPHTRMPAVAGLFYPADAQALAAEVRALLGAVPPVSAAPSAAGHAQAAPAAAAAAAATHAPPAPAPKLLIVPHAGYVYSGAVAAHAYARLRAAATIRRVVLIGPAHRVALRGLALPAADTFATPLGHVPLDRLAMAALAGLPQVLVSEAVHLDEHALEVQLPFLQTVLPQGFTLLPLAVGHAGADAVAEVLERVWGGDETLIVVSSDLSHDQPYASAQAADAATARRIAALAADLAPDEACGACALNGALRVLRRRGLRPELLDLRNSGDTAGDRRRVVGYAAFAAYPAAPGRGVGVPSTAAAADAGGAADAGPPHVAAAGIATGIATGITTDVAATTAADGADAPLGAALIARARNGIALALGLPPVDEPLHPALLLPGASFVTLHDGAGELRGCVGRLEPERALGDDVRANAHAAAFRDQRFEPLTAAEWAALQIEVSVLGRSEPLAGAASAADALRRLRPGVDGVTLHWRGRRATLLPQVWASLPRRRDFGAALWRKAGLPAGFWAEDLRLSRYAVRHFEGRAVDPRRLS